LSVSFAPHVGHLKEFALFPKAAVELKKHKS
jgi:hypothetical protein